MTSQGFLFTGCDEFMSAVIRTSDTLSNVSYLIELDAQNPGLVRQHAKQAINRYRHWKTWLIRRCVSLGSLVFIDRQ
jgi:hypothetical protein